MSFLLFCSSHGYEGIHKKRTEDFFDEGEATFYRTSRFTLVDVSLHRVADLVEKVVFVCLGLTHFCTLRKHALAICKYVLSCKK